MRRNLLHIALILSVIYLTGCSVYKADSLSVTSSDYNQRKEVAGTHYDKVLTPIGVTSIAASTAGGAYLGYQSNLIKYNSGTEQVTSKIGNAVIGAAVGFGSSYLVNRLFGWGKRIDNVDANEWVKKANRNYILVNKSNNITVIPKTADKDFKIKNLTDANQFSSIFNKSKYTDDVFKTGVDNCQRFELPVLINFFPNTQSLSLAKNKYITTSPSYSEIVKATQLYPDLKNDYEREFLNLITNCNNAVNFNSRFPNTTNGLNAYLNAYKEDNQSKLSFENLNKTFDKVNCTIDYLKNANKNIQKNYLYSKYLLEGTREPEDIYTVYLKYLPLKFEGKDEEFVKMYFKIADENMTDGDEILWRLRLLNNKNRYPELNVSSTTIENIVNNKLREEASKNVIVVSPYIKSNSSAEWENWLRADYTAGLVKEKGALYLLYGKVTNSSKYSLPIEIYGSGDLSYTLKGETGLAGLAQKALDFFGGGDAKFSMKNIGSQSNTFYIPSLPARSTGSYALVLNFSDNFSRFGINSELLGKSSITANLENVQTSYSYSNHHLTDYEKNLQLATQYFAENGLPDVNLTDMWRGIDVKKEEWDAKWERIQEERRIAAEYARTHPTISDNSSNSEINSCTITVKDIGTIDENKPYYEATIKKGNKTKTFNFYYHEGNFLNSKGYHESTPTIEYERFLGESLEEAKKEILEIMCKEFD